MDVEPRFRREVEPVGTRSHRVAAVEAPRRWGLPVAVGVAIVAGAASVPLLMAVLGSGGPQDTASLELAPSAAQTGVAGPGGPSLAPVTQRPRATLSLADPRPVAGQAGATRAGTSAAPSASVAGPRTASIDPASGTAGRLATVTGACAPTDKQVAVGTTARQPLGAGGRFAVTLEVATQGSLGQSVQVPVLCLPAGGGAGVRVTTTFRVTSVVTMPQQVPAGAGRLDAPGTVTDGTVSATGSGFLPRTPVLVEVRAVGSNVVSTQRRLLSADDGQVSVMGLPVPAGSAYQLVAVGVDPSQATRVLVATVTSSGSSSATTAAATPTPS